MLFIAIPVLLTLFSAFFILVSPYWSVKDKNNRKKFIIFLSVGLLVSGLISTITYTIFNASQSYNEVWHYKITSIKHETKWSERESRTRQVACGTDKKGRTKYKTETYYVTEYYGPYWKAYKEDGTPVSLNKSEYEFWEKQWNNEKKVGTHKGSSTFGTKAITGSIYECGWTGKFETIFPHSEIHTYYNKIRRSKSVLKLKKPTEALKKQYPRPADKNNTRGIINYGAKINSADNLFIDRVNAVIGRKHQIHVIFVLFKKQNTYIVDDILSAWQGTNKNELVIFINTDENNVVTWSRVESWMDNTTYHSNIKDVIIENKPLNIKDIGSYIMKTVGKGWKRKEFHDFDYIKVNIPIGYYVWNIMLGVLTMIVTGVIVEIANYKKKKNKRW